MRGVYDADLTHRTFARDVAFDAPVEGGVADGTLGVQAIVRLDALDANTAGTVGYGAMKTVARAIALGPALGKGGVVRIGRATISRPRVRVRYGLDVESGIWGMREICIGRRIRPDLDLRNVG